jgi:hypothetical protein
MGLGKAQRQEGNQSAMLTEPLTVARNMLAFLCYPQGSTTNGHSDFLVHSPILGRENFSGERYADLHGSASRVAASVEKPARRARSWQSGQTMVCA